MLLRILPPVNVTIVRPLGTTSTCFQTLYDLDVAIEMLEIKKRLSHRYDRLKNCVRCTVVEPANDEAGENLERVLERQEEVRSHLLMQSA
jgi:hypothetical protein